MPMTCGLIDNVYHADSSFIPMDCGSSPFCTPNPVTLGPVIMDGYGTAGVYQNAVSITANRFVVSNSASIVFHAAERVRLRPGFHAGAGDAYFRAEIGPCNQIADGP